jgi:hypothetical protein
VHDVHWSRTGDRGDFGALVELGEKLRKKNVKRRDNAETQSSPRAAPEKKIIHTLLEPIHFSHATA